MSVWDKLDSALTAIYHDYLDEQEHGAPAENRFHSLIPENGWVYVALRYAGDLADIEALGFETVDPRPGEPTAGGRVELANLERVAAHPGVLRMSVGRAPHPLLDVSVPQINTNAGKVWTLKADKSFDGTTGKNVIIGIVDTGINFSHPFFSRTNDPKKTRILRIWDRSLIPEGLENKPDAGWFNRPGASSYGVEWDESMINAALAGAGKVRHRDDSSGHGTHVASIAAGNGGEERKYVGVAPEAELIVVTDAVAAENLPPILEDHFRDAINYILTAASKDRPGTPVVINLSIGDEISSHDGDTNEEVFLATTFVNEKGKACVAGAGNDSGEMPDGTGKAIAKNHHATVRFPAGGGSVSIPIELIRRTSEPPKKDDADEFVAFRLFYPESVSLTAEIRFPPLPAPDPPIPPQTPALGASTRIVVNAIRRALVRHVKQNVTTRYPHNLLELRIYCHPVSLTYLLGEYTLNITTSDELVGHLYCARPKVGTFRLADRAPVELTARHQIGKFGGSTGVITVGAYDAEQITQPVAEFSSRGPLVSHVATPHPVLKPDIAAPGVQVDAAGINPRSLTKGATEQMSGTSQATPHVAGVIALIFQERPKLTMEQIREALKNHRSLDPRPVAEEMGSGRLDAELAVAAAKRLFPP